MDWKYKHFDQEAVFRAPPENVFEATRAVVRESLGEIQPATDGFVARGHSAWHAAIATFHAVPIPDGTRLRVELLVERAGLRGYMLFDVGSYYNGQIDHWFSRIAQGLGEAPEQILVRKTTSSLRVQRGCLAGCLVYLVVGACLGIFATALDRARSPASAGSTIGPFGIVASTIGLLAGVIALLYVMFPTASASKFLRERLHRTQAKKRQE